MNQRILIFSLISLSEPDLVAGDGVYSRFLTNYPGVGTYSIAITASDNQVSVPIGYQLSAINSCQLWSIDPAIFVRQNKDCPAGIWCAVEFLLIALLDK